MLYLIIYWEYDSDVGNVSVSLVQKFNNTQLIEFCKNKNIKSITKLN